MTVQVWDSADSDFIGRLAGYSSITVELALSEAGRFTASAAYAEWRDLMEVVPSFHHVRAYGADGAELMHGIWLTRDDDTGIPGVMEMQGNDLLEELRLPCLPPEFYLSHYPVIDALTWLLTQSGTDWVIGDTSTAISTTVSANIGGESYLAAILELLELSGNYMRHDGVTRSLDVFAEPYDIVSYLYGVQPNDDDLPASAGRIVSPVSLTMDTGEVLRGVYPQGGSVIDQGGNEAELRPTGDEELPIGFSFSRLGGQIAIMNDAVVEGLVRLAEYSQIEPLSNRTVSMNGTVEATGNGYIVCEALRRPNDGFWSSGALEVGEVEYGVAAHSGASITGNWGTLAVGTQFQVERSFEYDAVVENEARQDLVDAACGLLRAKAAPLQVLSVGVDGLDVAVKPGDKVHLAWVATVESRDAITDELERFLLETFHGEMVVISVATIVGASTMLKLDLARELALLPTESGVREMRYLTQTARKHANNRVMAVVSGTEPSLTWPGLIWMDTSE